MDPADARLQNPAPVNRRLRLLPVSLVIAATSVLAAVAVPRIGDAVARSRAQATAAQLREFSSAFEAFAREHGDWPEGDGTPGRLPPGLERSLRSATWSHVTPIGGHYAWDPNSLHRGSRYRAAIVITTTADSAVTRDARLLTKVDRLLDDGALNTGQFVLGYRHYPTYVLEH